MAFKLAQDADAFGDVTGLPFGGEGSGGFLKLGQVEVLGTGLLAGDIAHPGEEEFHEGGALLEVVGLDLGFDLFFALLEPRAVGGLSVVILLAFEVGFLLFFDVFVKGFEDFFEVLFQ